MHFQSLFTAAALVATSLANPVPDGICTGAESKNQTQLLGDGDPHQNFKFKQISGTTDCSGNPSGSASITNSQTVGWSISAGFSFDFISGGFDVSESVSTGSTNSFGCKTDDGTQPGSLCVFERIQTTAYTVNMRTCSTRCGTDWTCTDWADNIVVTLAQTASRAHATTITTSSAWTAAWKAKKLLLQTALLVALNTSPAILK